MKLVFCGNFAGVRGDGQAALSESKRAICRHHSLAGISGVATMHGRGVTP